MGKSIEIIVPDTDFKQKQKITLDTERDTPFWINNVSGVSKEGLPARYLTGFLSTFALADTIHETTKGRAQSKVRIFVPSAISHHANGISHETIATQISEGTHMLQQMAENHFEHIELFVEKDQPMSQQALDVLEGIASLAGTIDDKTIDRIKQNGRRRGGEQGEKEALIYTAHHLLGWKDMEHAAVFAEVAPFTVINTMPPSEKPYTAMRGALLDRLKQSDFAPFVRQGQTIDMVMKMSDRPHYLFITDNQGKLIEPSLADTRTLTLGMIVGSFDEQLAREDIEPWTKDYLKKGRADFIKLAETMAQGRTDIQDATFMELLQNKK